MKTQNNNITESSKSHKTDKKQLFIGGVIVILIAITPFIFYSYKSFPEIQIWETYFFTFDTGFVSWYAYAWYLTGKFVPLFLLLIWFFTCKHWWHWIILVPIAMYSFQLWGLINESGGYDELEIIYVLPLMMVLVPFVYLIRAKLFNSFRGDDLRAFEEELTQKRSFFGQIKELFR